MNAVPPLAKAVFTVKMSLHLPPRRSKKLKSAPTLSSTPTISEPPSGDVTPLLITTGHVNIADHPTFGTGPKPKPIKIFLSDYNNAS